MDGKLNNGSANVSTDVSTYTVLNVPVDNVGNEQRSIATVWKKAVLWIRVGFHVDADPSILGQ
jgi:hypothetical protein